jgi:multidrug efflux pump subunit AcrA (membrane-fusion protein)
MKRAVYLILVLILVISAFLLGRKFTVKEVKEASSSSVSQSQVNTPPDNSGEEISPLSSGTVEITPERQQLIGLRVAQVEKSQLSSNLRILGRVAFDERRAYIVNSAAAGWVREISTLTVGSVVKKGEKLATFYSPEFLSSQQAYFYALNALDRFTKGEGVMGEEGEMGEGEEEKISPNPDQIKLTKANIQQYGDTLRSLGMGEKQIEELGRTRKFTDQIEMTSPANGIIIARNIYVGQRFEKTTEFFKITDLSRVWILADVFENEAQYLKPGIKAKVTLPQMKKIYNAIVSNVPPFFDAQTRTLKVRLEADNPGQIMRPDMFVDIELPVRMPPAITVPSEAIIFSGMKKTVFVDLGNGVFEPRQIETGWRLGNSIEVVKGLKPGDRIVISGNFLIDSESKLGGTGLGSSQTAGPESSDH